MGDVHEDLLRIQPSDLAYFGSFSKQERWNRVLLFLPFFAALASLTTFIARRGARFVWRLWRRNGAEEDVAPTDNAERGTLRYILAQNGGRTIVLLAVARILGCLVLVGVSLHDVLESMVDGEAKPSDASLLFANAYALLLACLAIAVPTSRIWFARENLSILLLELAVYIYRDVWPLATYDEQPMDLNEGWTLWLKIGALAFTVLIPLFVPNLYVPLDPKNPSTDPNPEQIASIASFLTFTHLSPTITASTKTAHLTPDQFPAIADYDTALALSSRAAPFLDPIQVRKDRHIFFGLLRLFAHDFFLAFICMTVYTLSKLLVPVAINRLLTALEDVGDQPEIVRPWFWILCVFIAPVGTSFTWQYYMWLTTRLTVQLESVFTQLLFSYSLRVRVKAESSETTTATAKPARPETPEASGSQEAFGEDGVSREATLVNPHQAESSESGETDSQASKSKSKKATPPEPPKDKTTKSFIGKLNNLATVDLNTVSEGRHFILLFYAMPIELVTCSVLLYFILGWSALVGLALMTVLLPVPGYLTNLLQTVQKEKMKKTDDRTQTVTESMNVLRMIKLFGWERKIRERIYQRREDELAWIWKGRLLAIFIEGISFAIPTITMLVTYATAALVMKMELTSARIFSSMILFDSMRNDLQSSVYFISCFAKGKVSLDRFNQFFKETELLDAYETTENASIDLTPEHVENDAIVLRNASFTWNPDLADGAATPSSQFILTVPGEVRFTAGKINLILGPTGSGKTSLLMALLGEMHFVRSQPDSSFNLPRAGGVSFAVQESWVQNETIRDNILFHSPYDEERYKKVLYQCALEPDLELFEAGDLTEVGERGLTLSGGQKARLTLARAIYSPSQVILLDDVLAALDVHTAKWIVNKCLKGDLVRGRTVLLVTHNIALAGPIADFIVSVSPDGVVTGRGQDISAVLQSEPALQAEYDHSKEAIAESDKPMEKGNQAAGKLIVSEEIETGIIGVKPIKVFLKALGGDHAYLFFALWISGSVFEYIGHSFNLWFIGYWSTQYEIYPIEQIPVAQYMLTYSALSLSLVVVYSSRDIWWNLGTIRASRTLHKILTDSILGATLRWLDETPISRITTRMTQDINSVDGMLVHSTEALVSVSLTMLINLFSAVFFVPLFTLPGFFIALVGVYLGRQYLDAQLSVKREMSNAKAPMLAHFAAAIAGLVSIRAYGAQSTFQAESRKRIDHYVKIARLNYDLNRWITIRIDFLGSLFQVGLAAYLTYASNISAANVGFSLNRAVSFCTMILYIVRIFNMFQVEANSLERIVAYTEIDQEPKFTESAKPPAAWPTSGDIRVENLTARYSKTGPAVLHGLSFNLRPGERVGVVGRTGSGKSSLTLSLLRCILTDGDVFFDGLNTSQINLDALRSNITIIPQLPELLSGTLRYNLDPFEEHDDGTLNAALRSSGLYAAHNDAGESRLSLDSNIASGGTNVSVGQRQIIALARAIVRSSKLLILDEATSAIDHETDNIIQNTLRKELGPDVTVLTIAHRLQTIIDADRIMVLDAGRIVEFASPVELLSMETGAFKALVDESGDKVRLYEVAAKSAAKTASPPH